MAVVKEHFYEWKNSQVTQAFYAEMLAQIENRVGRIVARTEGDVTKDNFDRAYIAAMAEMIEWRPEFIEIEELKEVVDVED